VAASAKESTMDGLMDVATTWIVSERTRKAQEREIGRAWLRVVVEGDADRAAALLTDLMERTQSTEVDVLLKLEKSIKAYTDQIFIAVLNRIQRRQSNRGCSCGCNGCEGEEEASPGIVAP
jgi:hypothetical protein